MYQPQEEARTKGQTNNGIDGDTLRPTAIEHSEGTVAKDNLTVDGKAPVRPFSLGGN